MAKQPLWVWFLIPALIVGALVALRPIRAGDPPRPGRACLSNLKRISVGVAMYCADYDDQSPPRDHWMDLIETVTDPKSKVNPCPSVVGPGLFGYSLNAGVKDLKGPNGDTTPLVYDSVNLARNASDLFNSLPEPGSAWREKLNRLRGWACVLRQGSVREAVTASIFFRVRATSLSLSRTTA